MIQSMTCPDKCFDVLMMTTILGVEDFDRTEKGVRVHSDPGSIMVPLILHFIRITTGC